MKSLRSLFCLLSQVISGALFSFVSPVAAFKRTVGPADNPTWENVSRICNGSDPANFKFGKCSKLIDCVYTNISPALTVSLGSGTNIASLLPTILALIGSSALELVQLALVSPHRALATCCFSIGLPNGLFRRLRPLPSQLSHTIPLERRIQESNIPLPPAGSKGWHNLLVKMIIDLVIVTLASVMLWQNYVVSSFTMVPWRCEYSGLLLAWPFAYMGWLAVAIGVLFWGKESIKIYQTQDPSIEYRLWELVLFPYTSNWNRVSRPRASPSVLPRDKRKMDTAVVSSTEVIQPKVASSHNQAPTIHRHDTYTVYGSNCITVRITMQSDSGLRSWPWYEGLIESFALGVYLYATFILTSTLYLNADKAIEYTVCMTLCLTAIRILLSVA